MTQQHHLRGSRNQLFTFGPDANKNNKKLQMILQRRNNLGSQRPAARRGLFCTVGLGAELCRSCAYRALLRPRAGPPLSLSRRPPLLQSALWKQESRGHVLHAAELWSSQQAYISGLPSTTRGVLSFVFSYQV